MPEPVGSSRRYAPGLDGLRAIAVLAVVFYHLEFGWAQGGLLGVGVFFTLSGYLITDILLARIRRGRIELGGFWLARARRLLPALFLMLAVVCCWVALIGPAQPAQFKHAVIAAVLYVNNWQSIFQHVSYFARFGPTPVLGHLWSLSVEEQFYLVWPLLLLLGVRFVRERPTTEPAPEAGAPARAPGVAGAPPQERAGVAGAPQPLLRPRLALATLALALASAVEMAVLYHPSFDPSRVYFGTDTRAFALLIGAALAMVWPSARLHEQIARGAQRTLDCAGVAGLLVIVVMIWRTSEYSSFLYRGGFVLLSLATACTVAVLVHPACRLGRVLGAAPLRWIGTRSYGVYLWSVPILVLTTPARDHSVNLARDALLLAAIMGVAALSWRFVEQPVRHGALGRAWTRLRSARWHPHALARRDLIGAGASLCLLVLACAGLALAHPAREPDPAAPSGVAGTRAVAVSKSYVAAPLSAAVAADSRLSSCHAVVHIGDSTSEGLTSAEYLPDPAQRIEAQYARVGATVQHYEISGARSIVERYEDQPNAYEVAQRWVRAGYHGCWVLAIGTNDTADVYVGSSVGRLARIRQMMSLIGDQPVMWVDVKTQLASGPYSEQNMQLWNRALLLACRSYPNMRVLNWAALARARWFIDDGIHYNTPGYAARARLIAQGLAHAFPAAGASPGCLVR